MLESPCHSPTACKPGGSIMPSLLAANGGESIETPPPMAYCHWGRHHCAWVRISGVALLSSMGTESLETPPLLAAATNKEATTHCCHVWPLRVASENRAAVALLSAVGRTDSPLASAQQNWQEVSSACCLLPRKAITPSGSKQHTELTSHQLHYGEASADSVLPLLATTSPHLQPSGPPMFHQGRESWIYHCWGRSSSCANTDNANVLGLVTPPFISDIAENL